MVTFFLSFLASKPRILVFRCFVCRVKKEDTHLLKLENVLERIEMARLAHLRWVDRAEALVSGLPLDKEKVPVLPTECAFGQWYYGEGRALRSLPSYQALEEPHRALHRTYQEIFKLLFGEEDRSLLSRLFGFGHESNRRQEAEALLPKLKDESKTMLKMLDLLEREVTIKARKGRLEDSTSELEI